MSKLMILAAVGLAAGLAAPMALAQSRPGSTAVTVSPARGGVMATPGRPTVAERVPIRPRGDDDVRRRPDRGDDDSHLRKRLRNACFNEPNPPSPLCRRVYGDQPGAGGRAGS